MGVSRANLGRGPAIVTIGGDTLFTRDDLVLRHAPVWNPVMTSMYGTVDKAKRDLMIRIPLRLWGSWENLQVLFPSALMNPIAGTSVFGTADNPVVVQARNGDRITYPNGQITKLANLYLGVDAELWAADVEITALIKNNANPEDAGAYFVLDSNAYTDSAFAKTNFKKVRWTGAWGAKTGFTTIVPQKGFQVSWTLSLKPLPVDGYGTVDMTVQDMIAGVKCIPIGPTLAQGELVANSQGSAMGAALSNATTAAADLTLTGAGGGSVVAKSAGMTENGFAFGVEPLRIGEMAWETTRGFAAGVPAIVASAS